ncbi:MAG: phosphate ABC transporter permease PstA [Thermoanaerobaculia bacterium]|nr:MAG: phosphate ABC transporter permease PstA [Thermoanaerobaculia bacterium]MBZ0102042.1 phosphate ABC transporter permease PstA [Thermoanaerobaculia bacterium]
MTALCGGALALDLLLVIGLLSLIGWQGGRYFWQKDLLEFGLADGTVLLGEVHDHEEIPASAGGGTRFQIRTGNRDLTGGDFQWIDDASVVRRATPDDAVMLERLEWGNFYGRVVELRDGDKVLAADPVSAWRALAPLLASKEKDRRRIRRLERGEIGDVNAGIEKLRLAERRVERSQDVPEERAARLAAIAAERQVLEAEYARLAERLFAERHELERERVVLEAADGQRKELPAGSIVRAVRPNSLSAAGKLGLYFSRVWEFVSDDPRESNTEGGIFPAIFGTVMMVFLMSIAVVPLGVLAALYLREYARQGPLVRMVRIAVNNLAGVPSIVFGVFGLGFFVYTIGGSIDRLFYPEALPTPTFGTGGILWAALTLALLTVPVVIVATEEGLAAVPRIVREGSLALGATKWETTWKVVIPAAAPGILTGLILAMARAAGEVAPLMIVGMVKLAPTLPIDANFPFVHLERKFMHLGFHIYDVGFQSPNVDASKPLVFATALLLIGVVTVMNLLAIALRNRLRRTYSGSSV